MEFCPICPTAYLDTFAAGSHTHLVLANFYGRDTKYAEWYRGRVRLGDTVILDNGAYEGELVDPLELLRVVLDLRPTVVVLPDVPNNFKATIKSSQDFTYMLRVIKCHVQTMQVVHATPGDLKGFENAYINAALSNQWVALSRLTPAYGLDSEVPELRRVQFISHLATMGLWRKGTYCHCLGMLNGWLDELPLLVKCGVRSIDSSAPIWRGLFGLRLTDHWDDVPFNPGVDGNLEITRACWNLKLVQEACNGNLLPK